MALLDEGCKRHAPFFDDSCAACQNVRIYRVRHIIQNGSETTSSAQTTEATQRQQDTLSGAHNLLGDLLELPCHERMRKKHHVDAFDASE